MISNQEHYGLIDSHKRSRFNIDWAKDVFMATALITAYSRLGDVERARGVFDGVAAELKDAPLVAMVGAGRVRDGGGCGGHALQRRV